MGSQAKRWAQKEGWSDAKCDRGGQRQSRTPTLGGDQRQSGGWSEAKGVGQRQSADHRGWSEAKWGSQGVVIGDPTDAE